MYQKYQDGLIAAITTDTDINAAKYFGELEKPQEGNFAKAALPMVYVDFVEDDTSNQKIIDIKFSLYIVHMSYSKNRETRSNAKNEIHTVLKEIYKNLAFKTIEDSDPITLAKLQKIFDANAAGGYLTVYRKDVQITLPNPILTGEI